jgi:hypothetical protein
VPGASGGIGGAPDKRGSSPTPWCGGHAMGPQMRHAAWRPCVPPETSYVLRSDDTGGKGEVGACGADGSAAITTCHGGTGNTTPNLKSLNRHNLVPIGKSQDFAVVPSLRSPSRAAFMHRNSSLLYSGGSR